MEERRKYIRIPDGSQISYKIVPAEKETEYLTKDISQGGIRFFVHHFIPKDSRLKIRFAPVNSRVSIEAMARLIWIREVPYSGDYEIGVQFTDISPKAAEHLIGCIKLFMGKKNLT